MLEKKKSESSPSCVRVSSKEREWLEQNAGSMTISAFIRWLIFGDNATPRKRRIKRPIKDYIALEQFEPDCQRDQQQYMGCLAGNGKLLQEACKAIIEIRSILMKALGLDGSDRP